MAIREEAYVYGNTVRQPRVSIDRQTALQPSEPKRVSKQVHKNRKRALDMNKGYVLFLSIAAIAALFICVRYLQIQSEITNRSEAIAALQRELTELKEENTAMYNAATDSVDLEELRKRAVEDLGMVPATPDQVMEYDSPTSSYVKQYEEIPENGILAQSSKVSK